MLHLRGKVRALGTGSSRSVPLGTGSSCPPFLLTLGTRFFELPYQSGDGHDEVLVDTRLVGQQRIWDANLFALSCGYPLRNQKFASAPRFGYVEQNISEFCRQRQKGRRAIAVCTAADLNRPRQPETNTFDLIELKLVLGVFELREFLARELHIVELDAIRSNTVGNRDHRSFLSHLGGNDAAIKWTETES